MTFANWNIDPGTQYESVKSKIDAAAEKAYAEAAKMDFDGSQRRSDIGRLHFE